MPTFNKKSQLWLDTRTLDEDEERWFDQEDDVDDGETLVPMNDVLKSKLDSDFDQINRFMENRKGKFTIEIFQLHFRFPLLWNIS